eukprot:9823644-Alexandrium_andersonii.AAC.1
MSQSVVISQPMSQANCLPGSTYALAIRREIAPSTNTSSTTKEGPFVTGTQSPWTKRTDPLPQMPPTCHVRPLLRHVTADST